MIRHHQGMGASGLAAVFLGFLISSCGGTKTEGGLADGEDCQANTECKSKFCNADEVCAQEPGGSCAPDKAQCGDDSECCSGVCNTIDDLCGCLDEASLCNDDMECCNGVCAADGFCE